MKKMDDFKKCLFLVTFFALSPLLAEAQSQQPDCFPDVIGCTQIEELTATITPPGYPECEIEVTYEFRVCQGELQIANVSFSSVPAGICEDFVLDLIDTFFNGTELQLERFLTNLYFGALDQIADMLFQEVLDEANSNNALPLLYCDPGLSTFTVGFYAGSCASFCVGRNDAGEFAIDLVSCGPTCCQLNKTYCIDAATGETVVEESVQQVNPGECLATPLPQCAAGSLFQSPCFEICETE